MNMIFALVISILALENPIRVNDSSPLPWYRGAEPPTPKNTVLVFVHGKHDDEKIWFGDVSHYGHNKMYELAYNAGYRTAFVHLGDESSMWYNGRVLARQIENIEKYYNTRNIVIIAHSKGGVDAQAALVYYNALGAPRKIISLSTPYYGSPLADLVFSNVYTTWLALIIGQATPATFVLQTAYMYRFQERISQDPDNQYIYYYTLSGWDHGPFPLWLGGAYLALHGGDNEHGGNDGAVTFQSAHVSFPNGHTFRVSLGANEDTEKKWYLNHFNIRLGQNVWQYIDSLLELYPVRGMLCNDKWQSFSNPITIRSTGYIKAGDGTYKFAVNPGTKLLFVKPTNSHIYLDKTRLSFKKTELASNIEYASYKTESKEKVMINGKFFIIGDETDDPLYITYEPIVKNTLPSIIIGTDANQKIKYNIFVKEYTLAGTFVKDISLNGELESKASLLLPLYDDALYNVHVKAFYADKERDVVFTLIKETDYGNSSRSLRKQPKLTAIQHVKNSDISMPRAVDILGRKTFLKTGGIFFKQEGNHKRPIILIK